MNACWQIVKAFNDEDNFMQDLSAIPELEKAEKLVKIEKYVGYSVRYKNIDFWFWCRKIFIKYWYYLIYEW